MTRNVPAASLVLVALFALAPAVGCGGSEPEPVTPASAHTPGEGPKPTSPTSTEGPAPAAPAAEAPASDKPGAPDATTITVPQDGTDLVRGRSTLKVAAPIDKVRQTVMAFAAYPEFMPHYVKAKVLGKSPSGGKDVYMEVEALNGAAKMWARIDVPKAAMVDGTEVYDTKFLDGNVRDFKAIWRIKKLDDAHTELSLEVFMHPKLPMPTGVLNSENVKGAATGVAAMRARCEGKK